MTEHDIKKRIGTNSRKFLGIKNITITELSRKSGVCYRSVEKMLNGMTVPATSNLVAICTVLECDPYDLFQPIRSEAL